MAGSVNKVILVGNLGRDPEVRNLPSGQKVVNFTLATSETWNDRNSGERRERTEWHRIVVFNEKLGEIAERYLRKGSKAFVEGQLQTRKWTDQSGQEKFTTEVVVERFRGDITLLGGRGEGEESRSGGFASGGSGGSSPVGSRSGGAPSGGSSGGGSGGGWDTERSGGGDLDDEIPF